MALEKVFNRGTEGLITLQPETSKEIWAKATEASAIMQLGRKIHMPAGGVDVPMITGNASASWVSEGGKIGVSKAAVNHKILRPYKLAVIELFSTELSRDYNAIYSELIRRLPNSLGRAFDETVFGLRNVPGSQFDQISATTQKVDIESDAWKGLIDARAKIGAADGVLDAFVLSPQAEGVLLTQTDKNGRPLFVDAMTGTPGVNRLIGATAITSRAIYKKGEAKQPNILGYAGDFTNACWGMVEDIKVSFSDSSTVSIDDDPKNNIHMWERDMFGVRVVCEVAFGVDDLNKFVVLNGATPKN